MIEPPRMHTVARRDYDVLDIEILGRFTIELGLHTRVEVRQCFERLLQFAGTNLFHAEFRPIYDFVMRRRACVSWTPDSAEVLDIFRGDSSVPKIADLDDLFTKSSMEKSEWLRTRPAATLTCDVARFVSGDDEAVVSGGHQHRDDIEMDDPASTFLSLSASSSGAASSSTRHYADMARPYRHSVASSEPSRHSAHSFHLHSIRTTLQWTAAHHHHRPGPASTSSTATVPSASMARSPSAATVNTRPRFTPYRASLPARDTSKSADSPSITFHDYATPPPSSDPASPTKKARGGSSSSSRHHLPSKRIRLTSTTKSSTSAAASKSSGQSEQPSVKASQPFSSSSNGCAKKIISPLDTMQQFHSALDHDDAIIREHMMNSGVSTPPNRSGNTSQAEIISNKQETVNTSTTSSHNRPWLLFGAGDKQDEIRNFSSNSSN